MEPQWDQVRAAVRLNRLLFEERGSEFAEALAKYIVNERILISDNALQELVEAARWVKPS
jgi:hypothetical protein